MKSKNLATLPEIEFDWKLLRKQKKALVKLLWDKRDPNDILWGLVSMIDAIQDELVNERGYNSEEVFG